VSPRPDKDRELDFGRSRLVKGRGQQVRLSLAERLRAARRVPQAVVKVVSFTRGEKRVRELMGYISRLGELPLETETGDLVKSLEEQKELARTWASTFDKRKNSRDAAHIVFSMPAGSSPEALRKAVRKVVTSHFAGHRSVFVVHEDRRHPHAHAVIQMRGREKKLELKKADLHRLREVFAEAAREQGVMLAASPRAARGVGRKAVRRPVYQLRTKGIVPRVHEAAASEFMEEVKRGEWQEKPWEKAMRLRHGTEKQAYLEEARKLRAASAKEDAKSRDAFLKAAGELELFSRTMPAPRTRRMSWLQKFWKAAGLTSPERGKAKDPGWER
jgi:hypothetical protein